MPRSKGNNGGGVKKVDTKKNKDAMIAALESTLGVVTPACRKTGVSPATHYKWMNNDEEYKAAVLATKDIALDFAESQLHQQIKSGNPTSTIFYLKTQGKHRGYVERQELTGKDGGAMSISIPDLSWED